MKAYKNRKVDLEPRRAAFFTIGLVLASGLTLCAFEWRSPGEYVSMADFTGDIIELPEAPPPIIKYVDEPKTQSKRQTAGLPQDAQQEFEFKVDPGNTADDDDLLDIGDGDDFDEETTGESEVEYIHVFKRVEQMPSFPGGEEARMHFLSRNLKAPYGYSGNVTGRVEVSFIVWTDGTLRDVKINSEDERLTNEVLRVLRMMPKWIPGQQADQTVPVRLNMPVVFSRG